MQRTTSRNNRQNHGLGGTPTYRTWYSMIERCCNPANASFKRYGARGIMVCERWRASIEHFVQDMGARPPGMTLDRIDPQGNYEPSNCRWATELEQQRNRRGVKLSTESVREAKRLVDAGASQSHVAQLLGVHPSSVSRFVRGETWL